MAIVSDAPLKFVDKLNSELGGLDGSLQENCPQLWGQSPPNSEFNFAGFDRFEFKFRPKRSDFGRKKLRTAETGVGFRLSEVVLSPGRRGGKLGGLQQALRRTPVSRFLPIAGLIRTYNPLYTVQL